MVRGKCLYCKQSFDYVPYKTIGKYCSVECKNNAQKSKIITEEIRKKMSEAQKRDKNHNWKGGKPKCLDCGIQLNSYYAQRCKICTANNQSEKTRKKIGEANRGVKSHLWKDGRSKNKRYVSWMKNKRNRVLKKIKNNQGTHTYGDWELLKKQYGYTCPCCKKSEPQIKLTEDHIIPLSRGGSDLIENIQPLCKSCNCKKHTKIIKY